MYDQNKKWKIIEQLIIALAISCFGTLWLMSFWLRKEMPQQPETATGHTVPLTLNGTTVYITYFQHIVNEILFWGYIALFVTAAIVDIQKNPYNRDFKSKNKGR